MHFQMNSPSCSYSKALFSENGKARSHILEAQMFQAKKAPPVDMSDFRCAEGPTQLVRGDVLDYLKEKGKREYYDRDSMPELISKVDYKY